MASDMPKSAGKFPTLDSCKKRILRTHEEVDLAPHLVVGLVFQVGDTEKFSLTLGSERLDPFFVVVLQSQQTGSMFDNRRGGWR